MKTTRRELIAGVGAAIVVQVVAGEIVADPAKSIEVISRETGDKVVVTVPPDGSHLAAAMRRAEKLIRDDPGNWVLLCGG